MAWNNSGVRRLLGNKKNNNITNSLIAGNVIDDAAVTALTARVTAAEDAATIAATALTALTVRVTASETDISTMEDGDKQAKENK